MTVNRPHVVILGCGFGGLFAARALARAPVRLTVLDRTNHHLFQPLLYQVATAGLAAPAIAAPIRQILAAQRNTTVLYGECERVDTARRAVELEDGSEIGYDNLIVATGSTHSFFGHDKWAEFAPGLKTLEDALEIRRRILLAFEHADLSAKAKLQLERLGVTVCLGRKVSGIDADGVQIGDERLASKTVVWAAGVAASPLGASLEAPLDSTGRVIVEPDLSLPGHPEVSVIGDLAALPWHDPPVPATGPAAKQMGRCAARNLLRRVAGMAPQRFRYRDYGSLATIGRSSAVALLGRMKISGYPAWLMWLTAHIFFLIGFRNRLAVLIDWAWAYWTFERSARIVSGGIRKEP